MSLLKILKSDNWLNITTQINNLKIIDAISRIHFLKSFLSVIFIEYHCSSELVIILKKFENSIDKFNEFDIDQ